MTGYRLRKERKKISKYSVIQILWPENRNWQIGAGNWELIFELIFHRVSFLFVGRGYVLKGGPDFSEIGGGPQFYGHYSS